MIVLNSVLPHDQVIHAVEPRRWWHIQQRYLLPFGASSYERIKEKSLMLAPLGRKR